MVALAAPVFLLPMAAQDVIVGEPGWFRADGVPDHPPQAERQLRPEYPRELRAMMPANWLCDHVPAISMPKGNLGNWK